MRSRSRSAIENVDVAAATFVVGGDLQIADFTTLEAALPNLPVEGGAIVVLGGTYTPLSSIELPDKSVEIIGCGPDVTIFSMPTFVGALFEVPDGLTGLRLYKISNFSAQGGSVAGQEFWCFDDTGGQADCLADTIWVTGFETFVAWMKYNLNYDRQSNFWINYSRVFPIATGSIMVTTPNPAGSFMGAVALRSSHTIWIEDLLANPLLTWTGNADCDIWMYFSQSGPAIAAGAAFNGIAAHASAIFGAGEGDITFNGNGWDVYDYMDGACRLAPDFNINTDTDTRFVFGAGAIFLTDLNLAFGIAIKVDGGVAAITNLYAYGFGASFGANPVVEISGATKPGSIMAIFESYASAGAGTIVKLTDAKRTLVKATFRALGAAQSTVVESGSADLNSLDGCVGLTQGVGPTIIGASTRVEGATRYDKDTSSTNALVEIIPTITNPKGLQGIGTIKNTDGANSIDVKETFTDAFGTSSTLTTTVTPGNSLPLDLSINIGTGFTPYVSYKVEVIDTVAGNHATYVSHFTAQGVI